MAIMLGGVEYVTATEACRRLAPDVGPETLRNWTRPRCRHGRVEAPLLAKVRDPYGRPVVLDGEHVYRWDDVVEAELAKRRPGLGRPRLGQYARVA